MKVKVRPGADPSQRKFSGHLRVGAVFDVLAIEEAHDGTWFRIDDGTGGSPCLFESTRFELVDGGIPSVWRVLELDNRCLSIGPELFGRREFMENLFDGDPEAWRAFKQVQASILHDGVQLQTIVSSLDRLDAGEMLICAKQPWTPASESRLTRPTEDDRVPTDVKQAGFAYLFDVHAARAVLQAFERENMGADTLERRTLALIYHAENDMLPGWVYLA